jgi:hypothetical protein
MRAILHCLLFVGVASLGNAQMNPGSPPEISKPPNVAKIDSGNMTCSISVSKQEWQQSEPVNVNLRIENRTDSVLSIRMIPEVILKPLRAIDQRLIRIYGEESLRDEWSYVADLDLEKETTLPFLPKFSLELKPAEAMTVNSDIAELLWIRVNQSDLPHFKLFKAVPAGKYALRFELNDKQGNSLCRSNDVEVTIQ